MTDFDFLASARRTVTIERDALTDLHDRLSEDFSQACEYLLACEGRVIVSGIGKSGHIGHKIAATFASTGTPAFFVHPSEASHGDFGMITRQDVLLAISSSGNSQELTTLLPMIKRLGVTLIAMTGRSDSPLAEAADTRLDIAVRNEACPLNLAPTASTTVTLALGDALAVALLEARGFTAEDFAFSHPGGTLGRKLLLRVADVMHGGNEIPKVTRDTPLREALGEMTAKGFGMTTIFDTKNHLIGIFTDGDLRRCIDKKVDINRATVGEVMSPNPASVSNAMLAAEALARMQQRKITALIVTNEQNEVTGVLHMHDLLRAGIL